MSWAQFGEQTQELFRAFRTPGADESMILDQNVFIEQALPQLIANLDPADLEVYRRPYPTRESRLPIDGEPADVFARVEAYDRWLVQSPEVPKLLLTFAAGAGQMMTADVVEWCDANIASLEIARLGPAGHHAPEDQPDAIADAISTWIDRQELAAASISARAG